MGMIRKVALLSVIAFLCVAGAAFSSPSAERSSGAEEYKPVKQTNRLEAVIPQDLRRFLLSNPNVKFHVVVDETGAISDYLAVEATHVGLLEKGTEKLQEARFDPAMKDGKAVPGKISITVGFFDPEQRAWRDGAQYTPMGGSVSDAVDRRAYKMKAEELRYRESSPADLDEPLKMVASKLYLVHPPDEPAPTGKVVVEYWIDHEGNVRLPEILSSDDSNLSLSVLMTLKETRFEPPRRNGNPTYVKVRQPFNFD
jgi:TonB family protein